MVVLPVSVNISTSKPAVEFVGDGVQELVPEVPVREYHHIKGKLIIYCYDISLYVVLVSVVSDITPFLVFVCSSEDVFG